MPASASTTAPAEQPDPYQARCATPFTRTIRLLNIVRSLIAFGQDLAERLKRNHSPEAAIREAPRFGTANIALMLQRILHGLRLAEALEIKLANRPEPVRTASSAPRKLSGPRPKAPRPTEADSTALPTAEDIAQQLRTRPIHAVLLEICSNLGVLPSDPLWWEITSAVNATSFVAFFKDAMKRLAFGNLFPPNVRVIWPKLPPLDLRSSAAPAATGPPERPTPSSVRSHS